MKGKGLNSKESNMVASRYSRSHHVQFIIGFFSLKVNLVKLPVLR
jgi:hypothetical protein